MELMDGVVPKAQQAPHCFWFRREGRSAMNMRPLSSSLF